jgi:hypothetical protein
MFHVQLRPHGLFWTPRTAATPHTTGRGIAVSWADARSRSLDGGLPRSANRHRAPLGSPRVLEVVNVPASENRKPVCQPPSGVLLSWFLVPSDPLGVHARPHGTRPRVWSRRHSQFERHDLPGSSVLAAGSRKSLTATTPWLSSIRRAGRALSQTCLRAYTPRVDAASRSHSSYRSVNSNPATEGWPQWVPHSRRSAPA